MAVEVIESKAMISPAWNSDKASLEATSSMEDYFVPPIAPSKNRYKNVLPFPEDTRVKLSMEGEGFSDYINANFVDGEVGGSEKYYIACQAPLENTIQDYWRMIWEQKCGVIVMLTPLVETFNVANSPIPMARNQANCYWPPEGKVSRYGNLLIYHKRSFVLEREIIVRSLLIRENNNQSTTREIIQLHYEGWPDNGIPTSTSAVRNMLVLVTKFKKRSSNNGLTGSVVVHCSAGLGRTGSFIAAHITLHRILNKQTPKVRETVEMIRKQRMGLVRNENQVNFIYAVVQDAVNTPGLLSELSPSNVSQLIESIKHNHNKRSFQNLNLNDDPPRKERRF